MPKRRASRTLRLPLHLMHARRALAELHARPRDLEQLVDAALDLGTRGLVKVKASQKRSEILELARAIAELKPATILEIGTDRGGTLLIWAQLATRRVITCDLELASYRRRLYERFPPPRSDCRIHALRGDSHDPAFRHGVARELGGEPVDFLFIDGDHSEAGVAADYEDYRSFVRPGGLIAFHDIVERQPFPDTRVYLLWQRLRALPGARELVDDPAQCGFGIGIVQV